VNISFDIEYGGGEGEEEQEEEKEGGEGRRMRVRYLPQNLYHSVRYSLVNSSLVIHHW
jgi:hypothetical protein